MTTGDRAVFRKSGVQVAADGCAAPVGAVLFLGMAALGLFGVITPDIPSRLFITVGFGFFGPLMAAGSVGALGRGTDDRVIEVGPDGVWLPEMGRLPWSAIAEVRLGTMRGVGSGDAPVTVGYRRLGFVPRDPTIRPSATTSAGWAMARLSFAFVRRIGPQLRLGGEDDAPFSAGEPELSTIQFERLLEATRGYIEVVDSAARRARASAPRWGSGASPSRASELSVGEVAALDAGLLAEERRAAPVAAPSAASGSLVDPNWLTTSTPRATFGPPKSSLIGLIGRLFPAVIPVFMMISFPAMVLSSGDASPIGGFLVLWVLFLGGLVVAALRPLFSELRRRRQAAAQPVSLEVGPEGIRIPPDRTVPWDDVAEIRTERAGFTSALGSGQVERWRLVMVRASGPAPGRSSAVESDRIDARFDDVLDLITFYHPVREGG